mgnify:CR=1 FL=1
MTLSITDLFTPATPPDWLSRLLTNAAVLKLKVSSWQSGDPSRTILSIFSYVLNLVDSTASAFAQGGFLDLAATGTVQYWTPNADGTTTIVTKPVTPDPSDPAVNPTGAPGALDVLCDNNYNVKRIWLSAAGGTMAVTNTSLATYGPYAVGAYHVSNQFNKASYSNAASLTIPPSSIAGTSITLVNASSGLIRVTTSANHGLTTGDAVTITGVLGTTPLTLTTPSSWYVTVLTATTFTLQGSNFSGSYTSGGLVYVPTVASFIADVAGSVGTSTNAAGVPAPHTIRQAVTVLVGVSVDNLTIFYGADTESNPALAKRTKLKLSSISPNGPRGAAEYAALSASQLAPLLSPPLLLSAPITRAERFIDVLSGQLILYVANQAGVPSAADLAVVQAVVDAYATPDAVIFTVAAPTAYSVSIVADVYLAASLATAATQALLQTALQEYFATLPLGGVTDASFAVHVVPYSSVVAALYLAADDAGIALQDVNLLLNGAHLNLQLTFTAALAHVAVLSPAVPTITLYPV